MYGKKGRIKEYIWLEQYYLYETILSVTFLAISVILELVLLEVYVILKKTRNTAGKILISFCIALLVCDIIVLILSLIKNDLNWWPCRIVALILHFFSLALCTWPCIMTYDLWSILRCKRVKHDSNILYLRYSIVAWGFPFLVTAICVTVDILSNGLVVSYGNQNHCWISPFHARLVGYIVPFSFMNYGSFLVVFIVITQTKLEKRKKHSMLAKTDQLNLSKMTMKLCMLFGTAELIGLIQIPNARDKGQSEVVFNVIFGFIYNFLRSVRGIFMFALFAANVILEKYRERSRSLSSVSEITR